MNKENIYDVIIIGGGPAGLTAGLYASRARLNALLIESLSLPTQLLWGDRIENYPGFPEGIKAFDLNTRFKKQAQNFGLEIVVGDVKILDVGQSKDIPKLWKVVASDRKYITLAIIVAVGAKSKKLNIPGEEKLLGKGVSFCATCDGPLYRNKNIIVIGGGDTAVEEALFLTKFAKKVILVHRRSRLRATEILQERALSNEKIQILWDSQVTEILGEERVEAVKLKNIKTQEKTSFSCEGIFVFVGFKPNTEFLKIKTGSGLKEFVKLDDKGYIIVDNDMKTSESGIFACGDCRHKLLRQIITACGDGATAAFSAQMYVERLKGRAYEISS